MTDEQNQCRIGNKYASRQLKYYRKKFLTTRNEGVQQSFQESIVPPAYASIAEVSHSMETDEMEDDYASSSDFDSDCDIETDYSSDDLESFEYDLEETYENVHKTADLKADLMSWYLSNNITKSAMGALLKIIKPHLKKPQDLPVDSRTFLKTYDKIEVKKVSGGDTVYLGIERIIQFLIKNKLDLPDVLIFDINIDGVEVFVNPFIKRTMWPVICSFKNIAGIKDVVFPISFYCGSQKPTSLDFLDAFINEYQKLEAGFFIESRRIKVLLDLIRMDIPAHSMVACTISHQGYNSCFKCCVHGEYYEGKVVFPHIDEEIPQRSNESFRQKTQPHHHTDKICNLLRLEEFDMIQQIPIDGMHCVYLGATKKLFKILFFGRKNQLGGSDAVIGKSTINAISNKILELKGSLPVEFHRNLRGIECLNRYKAKELRLFVMYIGVFVLKPYLSDDRFKHFLMLHCAVKILNDEQLSKNEKMLSISNKLLISFNKGFEDLYGKEHLSINLHLLTHLAVDVKRNGPLDSFSCFVFENFLGKLKKCIKSPNEPLKQVAGKYLVYYEHGILSPDKNEISSKNETINVNGILLSSKFPNCVVLLENKSVIKIKEIQNTRHGYKIKGIIMNCKDFFTTPLHSSTINCFEATESDVQIETDLNKVTRKMMASKIDESSYILISYSQNLQFN